MHDVVFLELLNDQDLFPGDLREQVQAKATRMEKAVWFVDNAIDRSLYINDFKPLCKLLTVMADKSYLKNDSLKQLAADIEQQLNMETSLIATKETSKGYYTVFKDICMHKVVSYYKHK